MRNFLSYILQCVLIPSSIKLPSMHTYIVFNHSQLHEYCSSGFCNGPGMSDAAGIILIRITRWLYYTIWTSHNISSIQCVSRTWTDLCTSTTCKTQAIQNLNGRCEGYLVWKPRTKCQSMKYHRLLCLGVGVLGLGLAFFVLGSLALAFWHWGFVPRKIATVTVVVCK